MLADEVHRGRVLRRPDGRFVLVPGKFPPGVLAALRGLPGPEVVVRAYAGATACRGRRVKTATPPRVALRWPDEVAEALGVSRSWLYEAGSPPSSASGAKARSGSCSSANLSAPSSDSPPGGTNDPRRITSR